MKIAVVGTGYVGLIVGTGLAENGHFVTCVDRDPAIIERLRSGQLPIYEPGLEELVVRNVEEERLRFSSSLSEAVAEALADLSSVWAHRRIPTANRMFPKWSRPPRKSGAR